MLRTSAMALVCSAAEYATPVELNSVHLKKIDTVLDTRMRLITGRIKSTPTE